jgi:hypothetical protein
VFLANSRPRLAGVRHSGKEVPECLTWAPAARRVACAVARRFGTLAGFHEERRTNTKEATLEINRDFKKLLRAFTHVDVRYLLVGAFAVEYHGQPRTTRHMDLWLDDSPENLERAYRALAEFGVPPILIDHLNAASPLEVVWIGVPPNRIDLAKGLRGLDFAAAWDHRVEAEIDGLAVHVIGRRDLIASKRECGRAKDIADADALESRSAL